LKKNWSIEAHRKKIAHVEIDFLARDSRGMLHIVEVKSAGAWDVGVLSENQQRRLFNVAEILSLREPIGLLVLVVEEECVTPIRL
jgi:Holliday junction resolvase-like predicted endonuclease